LGTERDDHADGSAISLQENVVIAHARRVPENVDAAARDAIDIS
jgi:seryl-tRNA(Sec) selenium transferase